MSENKLSEDLLSDAKAFDGASFMMTAGELIGYSRRAKALEAKLEAMERVVEVAEEAERIANEAHLAADHYAYDLMRTVLRPLVGEMERSVEQALAAAQEEYGE